ncbi:MAG: penicillin-binding protein 2 [Finegoldia sp.]|nr:penicillin-binding protein 2 [Finegoldia sp.]
MNSKTNKKVILILAVFCVLFSLLVLYMTYFQIVKAEDLANNENNKRLWVDDTKIARGDIYDRDGNPIVQTEKDENGNNYRLFNYENIYGNITGYNSKLYGTAGLEKSYTKELLNIQDKSSISQLRAMIEADEKGNDMVLTTNTNLQRLAYNLLDGRKGSVVMLNPKTGEIYVIASSPSYNPNTLEDNWKELSTGEDAALLNRATQGMYTPGSVFKIITSVAVLENPDLVDEYVEDNSGTITFNNYTISNNDGAAFGSTDLRSALIHSSNVYFANQAVKIGSEKLSEVANRFMIDKKIPFDIPVATSIDGYTKTKSNADIATTSFGQGETLVTPLNMAMAIGAIANGGNMMRPYMVDRLVDIDGNIFKKAKPEVLSQVTSEENANILKEYLMDTANNYSTLNVNSMTVMGKSGTAEIKDKTSTHAWFVAAAPVEDPQFAVAVILEDSNTYGFETAAPIAAELLDAAVDEIGLE